MTEKIFESKKIPTDAWRESIDLADVVWASDEAENISDIGPCINGETWQQAVKLIDGSRWMLIWEFPENVIPLDDDGARHWDDGLLPWHDTDYITEALTRD